MFGGLYIQIRPSWRKARCSGCGEIRPIFNTLKPQLWRHLDFVDDLVYLEYCLQGVKCTSYGVVEEKVLWSYESKSRFTLDFEESVGYLVQHCDKTSVQEIFSIIWRIVGRTVERVYQRHHLGGALSGLANIGVNKVSYGKEHRYLTFLSNYYNVRIVWVKEEETFETFARIMDR